MWSSGPCRRRWRAGEAPQQMRKTRTGRGRGGQEVKRKRDKERKRKVVLFLFTSSFMICVIKKSY